MDEREDFVGSLGVEDVAERDILEANLLPDVFEIRDINTGWNSRRRKAKDF